MASVVGHMREQGLSLLVGEDSSRWRVDYLFSEGDMIDWWYCTAPFVGKVKWICDLKERDRGRTESTELQSWSEMEAMAAVEAWS
jgi:hypothetical protein